MSRGFVREEDQEEVPMVPPRADLPSGVTNYVTTTGMNDLLSERDLLSFERNSELSLNENEQRIATNFLNAKINLLNERIATAKVVDLTKQPKDEVRFGAFVTISIKDKKKATLSDSWS